MSLALLLLAGEIVRLSAETRGLLPGGKEVDAIHGDFILRNDRVVAVIAGVAPGRHANLSCKMVQGAVLDFSTLEASNDQLTAFMPHGDRNGAVPGATEAEIVVERGAEVVLRVRRPATEKDPVESVTEYSLKDGDAFLKVTTRHRNSGPAAAPVRVSDKMRCDQTFQQTPAGTTESVAFWDKWFGAAYAVIRRGGQIRTDGKFGGMFGAVAGTWIDYPDHVRDTKAWTTTLPVDGEIVLTRYLATGRDLAEVQGVIADLLGKKHRHLEVVLADPEGKPVAGADVVLRRGTVEESSGVSDARGRVRFSVPEGRYVVEVAQTGRARTASAAALPGDAVLNVSLGPRSFIDVDVRDGEGRPVACKVQFLPVEETPPLNLGPKQRAAGCGNLWYGGPGPFSVPLPAGKYYAIISHGPEHDAAMRYLVVREGAREKVPVRLPRTVDTKGWISADFHNHSTPSGDNTTEVESRILTLAAEQVEFAPATEHNRVFSYREPIRRLGLAGAMATSDGIELTGNPLPLSHHNAFPLVMRDGLQDNGGPAISTDPRVQLQRLLDHDAGAEKLLQQNHPDLGWLVYDADGDGVPDRGFGTLPLTHAIEAWGADVLEFKPLRTAGVAVRNNTVFNWLQLLNQGHRIPGVANTDAHYCPHESGRVRNYVKSPTDAPSEIRELDVVRAVKAGAVVMTNGPFLEVSLEGKGPGETLEAPRGRLRIRVQCPNWLDVDRVQVLRNGRPAPGLNFTRNSHPGLFHEGPRRFEAEAAVESAADAHWIVVAIGETSTTGPVMGQAPERPCAVSNPIWMDVDGGGLAPCLDTLGAPLPVRKAPLR